MARAAPAPLTRRRFLQLAGGVGAAALLPGVARVAAEPPPEDGEWLAGDFHCHTTYSHDVWAGPSPADIDDPGAALADAYTWGWTTGQQIRIAESRRLDFLAITDHDRVDALRDPAYESERLVLVPGYEHSLSGGHVGVFTPSRDALPDVLRAPDGSTSFPGDEGLEALLEQVHERAGMAVLNHPFYGGAGNLAWGYGIEASLGFDAVEVWNIHWLARHDIIPFLDSDNYQSVPWWETELVARRPMAAVGGSDNHWRATTAIQGVGQPTTWVYAANPSPAAIIDAVRAGRTFITAQPPALGGATVHLHATEERPPARHVMVGGTVAPRTPLEVTAEVHNGAGNRLRFIVSGSVVAEELVRSPSQTVVAPVVLPPGGWVRAELLVDYSLAMTALTSPIYAAGRAPRNGAEPSAGPPASYGTPADRNRLLPLLEGPS